MLLPAAIVVILMCYIPMGGIVLAFKEYNYHCLLYTSRCVSETGEAVAQAVVDCTQVRMTD